MTQCMIMGGWASRVFLIQHLKNTFKFNFHSTKTSGVTKQLAYWKVMQSGMLYRISFDFCLRQNRKDKSLQTILETDVIMVIIWSLTTQYIYPPSHFSSPGRNPVDGQIYLKFYHSIDLNLPACHDERCGSVGFEMHQGHNFIFGPMIQEVT